MLAFSSLGSKGRGLPLLTVCYDGVVNLYRYLRHNAGVALTGAYSINLCSCAAQSAASI